MQRDAAEVASLLYFLYSYMQGECRKIWYAVLSAAAIKKFRRTEKVSVLRNLKNQANLPLILIFFQKLVNLIRWRLYTGNGYIVVQGIDDGCQEFAHICFLIIRAGQQFLRTIIQICSYDFADVAFFVIFIEFRQTVGEKTKRCADKNTTCLTLF